MGDTRSHVLLDAIKPDQDAVDAKELSYPNLKEAIDNYYPYEYEHLEDAFADDSLSPEETENRYAHEYLLLIAQRLQDVDNAADKQLWSQRYTEASIGVYGEPDMTEVSALAQMELANLEDIESQIGNHKHLLEPLIEEYQSLAQACPSKHKSQSLEERYGKVMQYVRKYFLTKYVHVFSVFDDIDDDEMLEPARLKVLYTRALDILERDDPAWEEWSVVWYESASLSVDVMNKNINVGRYRAAMPGSEVRGLFAHEVLVHAHRAVNGGKLDRNLAIGLPGYLDAEEGFGVLVESAINGRVSNKVKDRYIDIALALGNYRKNPMNRRELFAIAYARAVVREAANGNGDIDYEQLKRVVWEHVNRIYRGTLGNHYVGVFTKDIAYYKGFCQISTYMQKQLSRGIRLEKILAYILRGKFNPSRSTHADYVWRCRIVSVMH